MICRMPAPDPTTFILPARELPGSTRLPVGEMLVIGSAGLLDWVVREHPLTLLPWVPWHFSWLSYLGIGFALLWYCRGVFRTEAALRPSPARLGCFLGGLGLLYVVLLTEFEYLTQHMFFLIGCSTRCCIILVRS